MSNAVIRTKKIKAIIRANIHLGEQTCADKINAGGFPGPGGNVNLIWHTEHIKPMMAGKISMKRKPKVELFTITTTVNQATLDFIYRNSDNNAAFVRAAINEKIEREAKGCLK